MRSSCEEGLKHHGESEPLMSKRKGGQRHQCFSQPRIVIGKVKSLEVPCIWIILRYFWFLGPERPRKLRVIGQEAWHRWGAAGRGTRLASLDTILFSEAGSVRLGNLACWLQYLFVLGDLSRVFALSPAQTRERCEILLLLTSVILRGNPG